MKLLIITNSYDATTDLLITKIGKEHVFRFSYDQWDQYSFQINQNNFCIKGEYFSINENEIAKVYWRKPFLNNFVFDEKLDAYLNKEITVVFRDLFNILQLEQKTVLVNPFKSTQIGKLYQLRVAKKYFRVPEWVYFWNSLPQINGNVITKSLSSTHMIDSKFLFTSSVQVDEIDKKYPWLIQSKIEGDYDMTIVYINGECYAFKLLRTDKTLIDWREKIGQDLQDWIWLELESDFKKNVINFMEHLKLKFGRLDFMINNSEISFLEVNPNGQWAFLDLSDKYGLISKMVDELSPMTPLNSFAD